MRRTYTRSIGGGLIGALLVSLFVVAVAQPAGATVTVIDDVTFRTAFANPNETHIDIGNVPNNSLDLTCPEGPAPATRTSDNPLVIDGHGHQLRQLCPNSAVLIASGTGSLTLQNISITGGTDGGIGAQANITLANSTVFGITGDAAVYSGNQQQPVPGITLVGSTISGNTSPQESIVDSDGPLSLTNSTVTNNTSPGGALFGTSSVTLLHATVVSNSLGNQVTSSFHAARVRPTVGCARLGFVVVQGGAANVNTGFCSQLTTNNSVIALPLPQGAPNCAVGFTNGNSDYNFSDDASCQLPGALHNVENGGNPQLGSLGNNGGPTQTRSPVAGGPLVDKIPCNNQVDARFGLLVILLSDQRGISRPQGPACDIGAVELIPQQAGQLPEVSVTASPDTAVEGSVVDGQFIFTRTGDTSSPLGVNYGVAGSATSGTDYTPLGSVTIPAGQASVSIPVHALQDNTPDPGETVDVAVNLGPGYNIGVPGSATVTIIEDFCENVPASEYSDRETFDVHAHAIDCITAYGMAFGFDDGTYGPSIPISRAQIASMIARLMRKAGVTMPASPPDAFPGDDGGVHEEDINQLAALGEFDATTGQGEDTFNVSDDTRRDDMAQMLVNAYKIIVGEDLPAGPDAFTDDGSSDNEAAINALANAGVVEGTGGGLYDPAGSVSRAQMASFFVRFMQLLVNKGKLSPTP